MSYNVFGGTLNLAITSRTCNNTTGLKRLCPVTYS